MKTFDKCVNIKHQDFINLQNEFGYETAALLTRLNNMDIPSLNKGRDIIKREKEKNKENLLTYLRQSNVISKSSIGGFLKPFALPYKGVYNIPHTSNQGITGVFDKQKFDKNIQQARELKQYLDSNGFPNLIEVKGYTNSVGAYVLVNQNKINELNNELSKKIDKDIQDRNNQQQLNLFQVNNQEGIIASEKTIRDLAARMSDRIGISVRFVSDRSQRFKGKIENNTAIVNLAYATLDTPIHEILGHPIIRAIKNRIDSESNTQEEGKPIQLGKIGQGMGLYQNLLKELETGRGKEVLDRIKRDYNIKSYKNDGIFNTTINGKNYTIVEDAGDTDQGDFLVQEDIPPTESNPDGDNNYIGNYNFEDLKQFGLNLNNSVNGYSLEEQQEEAIVELLGLMTAEKLDNVKDGKLISLLKRLLKEMKQFVRSLLNQKEVEIDKLPDNMTVNDLADLLAYSNSKLILPGNEVVYTTPDNQQFKTYAEASNHISELAKSVKEVNLENININLESNRKRYSVFKWNYGKTELVEKELTKEEAEIKAKELGKDYIVDLSKDKTAELNLIKSFVEKNKEYEQSKEIIEEWKKVNNIQYNPEEIYSRGQEFSSVVGAYSSFDVNLMMQNLLQHIEDNEKAGGKFAISAFTKPIDKKIGHLEGGGGKIKFKLYPQSNDILWAANTDVYSGSVWDASEKVNKDKKSELLGVSYTKYPSLNNVNAVQPNLAAIVDDLAHHHNELGIVLTGSNFRLEYDEDIPYSTKKIINSINSILDQKYGKLVKPEIKEKNKREKWAAVDTGDRKSIREFDSKEEAEQWINESKKEAEELGLYLELGKIKEIGIQPTQTKDRLKESINNVAFRVADLYEEGDTSGGDRNYLAPFGSPEFKNKEYTSQALVNTKIARLKEVAKKYPRSLIRSEVKEINNLNDRVGLNSALWEDGELPFQKIPSKLTPISDEEEYNKDKESWSFSPMFTIPQQLNIDNTLTGVTFQFISKAILEGKGVNLFTKEVVNNQPQIITKKIYTKKLEELNKKSELGLQETELKAKLEELLKPEVWNKFQESVLNNIKRFGFEINKTGNISEIEFDSDDVLGISTTEENNTDEDLTSDENSTGKAKNFSDYGEYTISTKEKLSPRLKVWLSTIPANEQSYIGLSFPKLNIENTYLPIDVVINAINEATVGKRTPQSIIAALEKTGSEIESRYFLKEVARRLKLEQTQDSRIPNEFFSKFNQTKNEMVMIKLTPSVRKVNNEIVKDENNNPIYDVQNEVININRNEIPANLRENWFQVFSFENAEEVDNELVVTKQTYSDIYKKYLSTKENLFKYFDGYGQLINEANRPEVRQQLNELFSTIGVDLNVNTVDALIDAKINKYSKFKVESESIFNEKSGILGQIFSEFKPDNSNAEKGFGSTGMLRIAFEEAKYVDSFMNTSAKDGKNRSIWAYGLNNPFTREMWDILNSAKELLKQKEQILQGAEITPNEYILEIIKTHYSANSEILTALTTLTGESFDNYVNNLKWQIYNVTKSSVKGAKGKELKHMNEREFVNSQIQLFTNNTLSSRVDGVMRKWSYKFLTTPSDKTTMFILRTPDHKIELSQDLKSVKPVVVDLFFEKFKAEYNKIKAYLEGSEEYKKSIDAIETYEPKAFYSFAQFNVKSKFLWTEDLNLRNLDEVVDGISTTTYIKDKIKQQIEQDIAQTKKEWEKYGFIENGKLITGFDAGYLATLPKSVTNSGILETIEKNLSSRPELKEQYLFIKNEADRKITDYLVADFAINKHYFNIEASQVVLGDPAMFLKNKKQKITQEQFKNSNLDFYKKWVNSVRDNLSKRMAGLQGSGTEGVWETETANTIVISDPKASSKVIEDIKKLSPENAEKFSEIDSLDGQEFVTGQEDLALKLAMGKITKSRYTELLDKVNKASEDIEKQGFVSKENMFTEKELAIAQAHKPMVWALITDSFTKLRKVTYNKPSAFGLYPQFTQGLEIDKLRQSVYNNNKNNKRVDRIVMLSAAKLGAKSPITDVFNTDGTVNSFEIPLQSIDEIPRKYFRIQLEVPYKKSEEVRMLTQAVKLMFNEVLDVNFDGASLDLGVNTLTGKELKQYHDNTYSETFQLNYDNFLIDTGAKKVDGSYVYEDYQKLQETLYNHAVTQGYDLNELEGLQLTENKQSFKLPLAFSAKSDRYEKLLLSLINDIILQKIHGRSFVLGTEVGFKPTKKTEIVEGKEANDWINFNRTNIVFTNKFNPETGLLPQRPDLKNPSKTLPAQVLVSFKFFDNKKNPLNLSNFTYEKDGHTFLDSKKLSPELLKLIGIRVPTQAHASMADIEIVGFIPDFMGDLIIAPQDFTKQMGSDFDIDKLYSYMYNYMFNEKTGKLSKFNFNEDKIREARAKKVGGEEEKNLFIAIFGEEAKTAFQEDDDKFEKFVNKQKIKLLHNKLQDIYHIVLSNTEVYKRMLEGITEGNLQKLADDAKALSNQEDTELPSPSSDRYKVTEYFDNAAGKLGIGIYSANSTFLSLIEGKDLFLQKQQRIQYTNKNGEVKTRLSTLPNPFKIKNSQGKTIELLDLSANKGVNRLISMFQSASVDNAKLKILSLLNIDKNTMGVSAVMASLANDNIKENGKPVYNEDYIIKFISQPSVLEYLEGLKKGSDDVKRNPNKNWKSTLLLTIKEKHLQELKDLVGEEQFYKLFDESNEGYSEQDLDFGILEKALNTGTDRTKWLKLQLDVLQQFEYFESVAKLLRGVQNLTNSDAKGVPQTIQEALFKKQTLQNLLEKAENEKSSLVLGNISNIFEGLVDEFVEFGIYLPIEVYRGGRTNSPILPYATLKYDQFVKEFKIIQNGNAEDVFFNALESANLQNAFLSNVWSDPALNIADKSISEERLDLLKDTETNKSLATDIEEFKNTELFFNNSLLKPLFNSLKIKQNKKDPSLKFVDFSISVGLINPDVEIIQSLEYLRQINYPLFEKLIKYNLIVVPADSNTSLKKFIPNFYLNAIGVSEQLRKINDSLNTHVQQTQIFTPYTGERIPFSQFVLQIFQHYPNYAYNIENSSNLFVENKSRIEIPLTAENQQYTTIYDGGSYSTPLLSTYDGEKRKWRLYLNTELQIDREINEKKAIYIEIPTLGDYNLSEFNSSANSNLPISSIIEQNNPKDYEVKQGIAKQPIQNKEGIDVNNGGITVELGRSKVVERGKVQNIIVKYNGKTIVGENKEADLGEMNVMIQSKDAFVGMIRIPSELIGKGLSKYIYQATANLIGKPIINSKERGESQTESGGFVWKNRTQFTPKSVEQPISKEIKPNEFELAKKEADSKEPIEQNFFDGYRPNSDTSKVHTIRPEITSKYGKGVKTFTLVKEGVRTRTTRLKNWMTNNNPKVGDYFWQVNKKNPDDKILTRITAVYKNSDPRFKDNWFKEGWVDSDFEYVKNYDSAVEFEVVNQPTEIKPKIDISNSTKKSPYFEKDKKKFVNANKLIARGSINSSSEAYRIAVGNKANTGNYVSTDIVGISSEGSRTGRIKPDFNEIQKAINAGVTFITDTKTDRSRDYNIGEREVADYLSKNGYEETQDGVWNKPKIDSSKKIENLKRGDIINFQQQEFLVERVKNEGIDVRDVNTGDVDFISTEDYINETQEQPIVEETKKEATLTTEQTIQNPKAVNLGYVQNNYNVKESNTSKQNLSNILDNIKKNSTNKSYTVLADILLQVAQKQNSFDGVNIVFEDKNEYDFKTQTITIDVSEKNAEKFVNSFQYNFLHELVHHLTIGKMIDGSEISNILTKNIQNLINTLESKENLQKAINLLGLKTTPEQLLAKLANLRQEQNTSESLTTFSSEEERSILNPLINPFEFVSSILNDANTQKWMNNVEVAQSNLSVFGKFVDYIKGLFNNLVRTLNLSLSNKTALNEGLSNVIQILSKDVQESNNQLNLFASLKNVAKLTPTEPILDVNTEVKKEAVLRQEQRKNLLWNQYNKIQLDKSLTKEDKQAKIEAVLKRISTVDIAINRLKNDFSAAILEEELTKALLTAKEKLSLPLPTMEDIMDGISLTSSARHLINLSFKYKEDISPELAQSLANIYAEASKIATSLVSLSKDNILSDYKDITGRDITEEEFFNINKENKWKTGVLGGEDNNNPMTQYVGSLAYEMGIKIEQELIDRNLQDKKELNKYSEKYDFRDLLEERSIKDLITGVTKIIKNFKTRATPKYYEAFGKIFNAASQIKDGKNKNSFIKSEKNKIQFVLDLRYLFPDDFNKDMGEVKLSSTDKSNYIEKLKQFFIKEYSEYPKEYAEYRMNELISQAEKRFSSYIEERNYIFDRIQQEFPENMAAQILAENNWLAYNSPFLLLNETFSLSIDNMDLKNQTPYTKLAPKVTENGETTFVKWSKKDEETGETVKLRVADKYITNKPRRKSFDGNLTGFISDEFTQWEVEYFEKAVPQIEQGLIPPPTMLGYLQFIQEKQKEYLNLLPRYLNKDVEYFTMLDVPSDWKELMEEATVFQKFVLYPKILWDDVVKTASVPYVEKQLERLDLITDQLEREFNPKFQHDSFNQRGIGDLKTNDVYKYFDFIRNTTVSYKYKSEYEIRFKQAQFLQSQGALTNTNSEKYKEDEELQDWIINNKLYSETRDSRKQSKKYGVVSNKKMFLTQFERDKINKLEKQLADIKEQHPDLSEAPEEAVEEFANIQKQISKIQRQLTPSTAYDTFESYLRFSFLSWSPIGRIWDTLSSVYINGFSEATRGEHYNESNFAKGLAVTNITYGAEYAGYLGATTALFGGLGALAFGNPMAISLFKTSATIGVAGLVGDKILDNTKLKQKVTQLLLRTGALDKADYLTQEDQRDILEGTLKILKPYTLLEKADVFNKAGTLLPLFYSNKIKDKTDVDRELFDAFVVNENGELVWNDEEFNSQSSYNLNFTGNNSSEWVKFRKTVDRVVKNSNGDSASNLSTNLGKKSTWKRFFLFLKTYMPQAFNRTFTGKTYDPLTNSYYTGKLAGLYQTLSKSAKGQEVPTEEKAAYNAAMFQLSLWMSLAVAARVIHAAYKEADDDDKTWLWTLFNITNRTQADVGNTFDVTSPKWERTTSFIPQMKYIFDVIKFIDATNKALFGEASIEINDEMSRSEMSANKLIPKNIVTDVEIRIETDEKTGLDKEVMYYKMYDPTIDKESGFSKDKSYNKLYEPVSRTKYKALKLAPFNAYKQIDNLKKTNNIWK